MLGTPAIVNGQRLDANRTEREFREGWNACNGSRPVAADQIVEVKFRQGDATMICAAGNDALSWGPSDENEVRVWRLVTP